MRFTLTERLIEEARRYELRSACRDCLYWDVRAAQCRHGWPDEGQGRWPLDAVDERTGQAPADATFCKEFELR